MTQKYRKGQIIERYIEGLWFSAVIADLNQDLKAVSLRYLDDGNEEAEVPFNEIRESNQLNSSVKKTVKDTLPRPLAGLVEDDYEIRKLHKTTVIIHHQNTSDEAIIMNGAENKLAAGGGLRALRYLKK
jgi:hypothetical protein